MARRQRRRIARPKPPNLWVIAFQILVLVGFLIAVLSVTDVIGDGTSAIFESLTAEDIQVEDRQDVESPGTRTEDAPATNRSDSGSPDAGTDIDDVSEAGDRAERP